MIKSFHLFPIPVHLSYHIVPGQFNKWLLSSQAGRDLSPQKLHTCNNVARQGLYYCSPNGNQKYRSNYCLRYADLLVHIVKQNYCICIINIILFL